MTKFHHTCSKKNLKRSLNFGWWNEQLFTQRSIEIESDSSGQIIATSHDRFPPNGGDCKGNPLISGKPRVVKYYNLARKMQEYYLSISVRQGVFQEQSFHWEYCMLFF